MSPMRKDTIEKLSKRAASSDKHSDHTAFITPSSSSGSYSSSEDVPVDADSAQSASALSKGKGKASAVSLPRTRPVFVDSSDEEGTATKPRPKPKRKHKHRAQEQQTAASTGEGPSTVNGTDALANTKHARRFDWSRGVGFKARGYLDTRYEEWLHCDDKNTRKTILAEAEEHVVTHYVFPQHNSGDVRKAVRTWFRNMQRRPQVQAGIHGTSSTAVDNPPAQIPAPLAIKVVRELQKAAQGRASSGSALWAKENEGVVRNAMAGGGIGERQRAVKECFKALPPEEQKAWRTKAKDKAAQADNDPNQCFENQQLLVPLLARVLDQFPGFGSQNFGSVVICAQVGMRNEDGIILRNEMTIGARTDLECRSFGTFEGGASVEEKDRWERFVAMALPPNPVRGDPRLLVTDEGLPKLPDVDNSWTRDDIVAVLESFFRLSWLHMRPKEAGLQWGTVTAEPTRYLNAPWDSICVRDPTTFSLVEVIVLYTQLLDAQGKGTPFRFRSGEDSVGRESDAGVPHVVSGTTTAGARTTNPQTPTMGIRVVNVFSSPVHKALTSQRKDRHSATPAERNTNASSGSTLTDTLFSVREEGESDLEDGAPAGNAGSGSHQVSRRASVSESGVGAASTANRMEEQAGSRAESGERLVGGGPPGGVEGEPADAVGGEGEETSVRAEEPHASIPSPRVRKRTSVAVRESGGPSGIEDVEYDVAASVPKRRRSGRGKASDVEDDVVDGSLPKRRRSGRGKGVEDRGKDDAVATRQTRSRGPVKEVVSPARSSKRGRAAAAKR